jgi:hypothetical protein
LYVYCENNPVMYVDPTGESPLLIIIAVLFVMSTILIISTSPSAEYISEQPILVDFSYSFIIFKLGVSAVINFQDEYIEFYWHAGGYKGFPGGTVSIGTVYNYQENGDFDGPFITGEAGLFVGINHSFDPRYSITSTVKSTSLVFSLGPVFGEGTDGYVYCKRLTYDWS